jgi:hypothetical protein
MAQMTARFKETDRGCRTTAAAIPTHIKPVPGQTADLYGQHDILSQCPWAGQAGISVEPRLPLDSMAAFSDVLVGQKDHEWGRMYHDVMVEHAHEVDIVFEKAVR